MTTKLVRIDDDLGLVLDPEWVEQFDLDENTELVVLADADGIFLKPIRFASDEQVAALVGKIMTAHAETLRKLSL